MKLKTLSIFAIIFCVGISGSFAQKKKKTEEKTDEVTGYYPSYDDFVNENLVKMDEMNGWSHAMGSVTLSFKKGKEKEKKKCKEIWGFVYKGGLFRTDQKLGQFARVISVNNIVYYENGAAHFSMLKNNSQSGEYSIGYYGYLSNDLGSEMTPLPSPGISDANKKFKDFKAENNQHKTLYECMEKGKNYEQTRECIMEYNKGDEDEESEEETE